jgi:hypothetical protein
MAKTKPTPEAGKTPVVGMRLQPLTLSRLERIADALGTTRTGAVEASAYFAAERLGLLREDIAAAVDSLERLHGPDGVLIAIVEQFEADDEGHTSYVAVAATPKDTPPGADLQELEDWSGALAPVLRVGPTIAGTVIVTHDPSGVMFKFGVLTDPVVGNALAARIGDLPELVLAPRQEDPLRLRREIRESIELARKLRPAVTETEGAPQDDD